MAIVTPTLNRASFIEEAMLSVLGQPVPVQYVVMDGASTDNSTDIICRYQDRLHYWTSEPDEGMYDAVNKGFERTTAEVMGWLNSDDIYVPHALRVVTEIFDRFPEVDWLTSLYALTIDEKGDLVAARESRGFDREAFFRGDNLPGVFPHTTYYLPQEATFWRRSLWDRVGGCDPSLNHAGDFDLWARFFQHADLYSVTTPLAAFRRHPEQKTSDKSAYDAEAKAVFARHGGKPRSWLDALLHRRYGIARKLRVQRPRKFISWNGSWERSER